MDYYRDVAKPREGDSEPTAEARERLAGAINEIAMSRVYQRWREEGFGILTSWRSELSDAENRARFAKLKREVKAAGFGWVPIKGKWRDERGAVSDEPALFIPGVRRDGTLATDEVRDLVVRLGRRYEQESVIWGRGDGSADLIATSPGGDSAHFSRFRPTDAAPVFSTLPHSQRAFTFEGIERASSAPRGFSEAARRYVAGEVWAE